MKKSSFFLLVGLFCAGALQAQNFSAATLSSLQKKEDTLQLLAKKLIIDSLPQQRMRNDSLFIRTLVRTLQTKNSFYYPFDSVQGISKLYAPDSAFRIFSWSLEFDDYYARQRAAIQLKTADGSLKLIPLTDFSEFTSKPTDSVRTKNNWIGAVYYNIIKTEHNGTPFYTLFGIDDNSVRSNKKWIEVLTFDKNNQPVFGSTVFSFDKDSVKRPAQHRYSIEYKKEASILVNYVPEENMILVDHLISETDEDDKPYTFIPDGDSEGFKWESGKWVHIDKPFTYKIDMKGADMYLGRPPSDKTIFDKDGNVIGEGEKSSTEKKKPAPTKKAPAKKPIKKGGN